MTAPTPEQMRALANEPEHPFTDETVEWEERMRAALRAAANQLEAVQRWADHADTLAQGDGPYLPDLFAILTADTAPQEGRDE